jgi:hypothetical protein
VDHGGSVLVIPCKATATPLDTRLGLIRGIGAARYERL